MMNRLRYLYQKCLHRQQKSKPDNIKVVRIISSLTPRFQNFKAVLYNIKEVRTIEHLMAKLQLEEDQYKKIVKLKS